MNVVLPAHIAVREVQSPTQWADAATLIAAYLRSLTNLCCVGDAAHELAHLPTHYGPPAGNLVMAYVNDEAAGCCAFRPLPDTDHTNACEMKRLYVSPTYRGNGLGHALVEAVMESARLAGYSCMLLDTLNEMEAARALYEEMGFEAIAPYSRSAIPGAHHLRVML